MKICIFCKHFYVSTASDGYSEETPGTNWVMRCLMDQWDFDAHKHGTEEYRQLLMTAEYCKHFEKVEEK